MEKQEKIEHRKRAKRKMVRGVIAISAGVMVFLYLSMSVLGSSRNKNKMGYDIEKQIAIAIEMVRGRGRHGSIRGSEERELEKRVQQWDTIIRTIRNNLPTGVFMETDAGALDAVREFQDATRELLHVRYGDKEPYRVEVDLEFPSTFDDIPERGAMDRIVIECAPSSLVPHSIFTFLEMARMWNGGAFHFNAPHIKQVLVEHPAVQQLAFQEYSDQYPHALGTVGYGGRPSGPQWYVSTMDNSKHHGPGSQQDVNPYEADAIIGKVIEGFQEVVMERIVKLDANQFILDPLKQVKITKMTILVPDPYAFDSDEYVPWSSPTLPLWDQNRPPPPPPPLPRPVQQQPIQLEQQQQQQQEQQHEYDENEKDDEEHEQDDEGDEMEELLQQQQQEQQQQHQQEEQEQQKQQQDKEAQEQQKEQQQEQQEKEKEQEQEKQQHGQQEQKEQDQEQEEEEEEEQEEEEEEQGEEGAAAEDEKEVGDDDI